MADHHPKSRKQEFERNLDTSKGIPSESLNAWATMFSLILISEPEKLEYSRSLD